MSPSIPRRLLEMLVAALAVLTTVPAGAQILPSEPLVFGNGRLTVGGDVSASYGCSDDGLPGDEACGGDRGFFNYTNYEQSALRVLSVGLSASVNAGRYLSLLGELRSDNGEVPEPYALYARVRPWPGRAIDLQIGLIPPTFGAFSRRRYPPDNLLIGYPLAYQYLTSLRPDALPATVDELLGMRGRGWLSRFSVGNPDPNNGVPLVNAFRWDTGVQAHATIGPVDAAISVTTGTLAHPLVRDDNAGKQTSGRVTFRPNPGLLVGASAARGPFVADSALEAAGPGTSTDGFTQTSVGADLEYSRGYYLIRAEAVLSEWRLPLVSARTAAIELRATSMFVEGRYRLRPGLYAAARLDYLGFSTVAGTVQQVGWDAPVTRVEVGGGWSIRRALLLKASFQRNTRETSRVPWLNVGAAQVVMWF